MYLTVMIILAAVSLWSLISIILQRRRCTRQQDRQQEELKNLISRHTEDLDEHLRAYLEEHKHIKHIHEVEDSINE